MDTHYACKRDHMTEQIFPEPTVRILIFNPHGELLLTKSHKWRGKYVVPGGHIELGESAVEAAHREIREETSLEIRDLEYLSWQEFIYDEQFWKPCHFIFLNFMARMDQGEIVLNDEAEEFIWMDPQKALTELDTDSYTAVSIRTYLSRAGIA
ncbi:MAG TPA: NUDIX domain-containing protein [Anaerolineales bacterium]